MSKQLDEATESWVSTKRAATTPRVQAEAYHGPVDVPKGSLLAVQDLPLDFILFPVNPADQIIQFETECVLSWN